MMNILQYHIPLIQPQIHQPVINLQHRLNGMCVSLISMGKKEPITAQDSLDLLNYHQTPHGKSKVNISLCRRKRYQRTYIEDIHSIFDQVRPVVSHFEDNTPKKPPTPNNIGEVLKGPQRQFWKEALFVQYDKNQNFSLL